MGLQINAFRPPLLTAWKFMTLEGNSSNALFVSLDSSPQRTKRNVLPQAAQLSRIASRALILQSAVNAG